MKKGSLTIIVGMLFVAMTTRAGGLMTNTNYHIAFDRMMARGATFDVDAVYSNPAGMVWNEHEGWQLSLNFQKPWQNRDIETTVPGFLAMPGVYNGYNIDQKFEGKASAPIVPALFATYKKDRWAVGAMLGIVGSGGFVQYDEGVPLFNVLTMAKIFQSTATLSPANAVTPEQYAMDSEMKGKQYIFGGQLDFSYQITDFLSAAVGMRANYYDGYYRGHVTAVHNQLKAPLVDLQLDCLQRGWGFAPIVGVDVHTGAFTLAARYEFRTKISTENDTKQLDAKILNPASMATGTPAYIEGAAALSQFGDKVAPYEDGAQTRYDMPAMLSVAVGYEFTPKLRATAEYHFFDDKNAKMAGDRQKTLEDGTNEFLLGLEYDINDKFTVSCGGQRTDYGLSDDYQQHTSFACDSYSVGLGGAVRLNDQLRLNVGYFMSIYSDYTKKQANYQGTPYAGTDIFSRTNYVVGVGIDYKF